MVRAPKHTWKSFSRGQYWPHFLLPPSSSLGAEGQASDVPLALPGMRPVPPSLGPLGISQGPDGRSLTRCPQEAGSLQGAHRRPPNSKRAHFAKKTRAAPPPWTLTGSSSRSPGRSAPTPCARSHRRCFPEALRGQPARRPKTWRVWANPFAQQRGSTSPARSRQRFGPRGRTLSPDVSVPLLVAIHEARVDVVGQLRGQERAQSEPSGAPRRGSGRDPPPGWLTSGRLYGLASLTRVWSKQGTSPYRFFSWL